MTFGLVILAGGAGRRLGVPKAAARLAGQTFAQIQVQTGLNAGCDPLILVLGCDAQAILHAHPHLKKNARIVVCADWPLGQFASLRAGLGALLEESPKATPHAFVLPVDTLPVKTQTFSALERALDPGRDAAIPAHGGRCGHPVLVSSHFWPGLLKRDPARARLDHILAKAHVERVQVDDPGVISNINTPQELARLKEVLGGSKRLDQ